MSYKNFRFSDLKEQFGISQKRAKLICDPIALIKPSDFLITSLENAREMPLTTKKAVSEAIVLPVLREIRK